MITSDTIPLKKAFLWSLILLCSLIAAYLAFISLFSVWIGIEHMQQAGFWVPVLAGTLSLVVVLWLFISATKRIMARIKKQLSLST